MLLLLLSLTRTESRRREGKRRDKDAATRDPSGLDELCVLYCPEAAPTRFLYSVYSSFSLTPRPAAQQHDITD